MSMNRFNELYKVLDEIPMTTEQRVKLFPILAHLENEFESLSVSRRPNSYEWLSDLEVN